MRCISSETTFYFKRVVPVIFAMFVMTFMAIILYEGRSASESPLLSFLFFPVLIALTGYFFVKILTPNAVDEVWDAGDALIVWDKGQEYRLALSDILEVRFSPQYNGARIVTLHLRTPSVFGNKVEFFAPFLFRGILNDLRKRIDVHKQA
jgi:hypothetical protein